VFLLYDVGRSPVMSVRDPISDQNHMLCVFLVMLVVNTVLNFLFCNF